MYKELKITIITPSYNQAQYIEQNILSVQGQNFLNVEHIIIDGGSTDGTVEILKKYPHLKWVSEKDEGQADALNKGLAMATGDIIGWINSDDYYEPDVFRKVISAFEDRNVHWVIGDIFFEYMLIDKKVARKSPLITYNNLLKNPDILRQQGTFFRKSFLMQEGGWDKRFQLVMDFDLWLRLSKASEPLMINENFAVFRMQPDQKTSGKNLLKQVKEMESIFAREKANTFDRLSVISKKYFYFYKDILKQKLIKLGVVNEVYSNIPVSTKRI